MLPLLAICSQGCSREHGTCRRPGTCRCRVGWSGPNCTECVRYPGCVHGSCKRPWECRCKPGWAGDLCNEKLTYCDEHLGTCQNGATCISMIHEDGDYRWDYVTRDSILDHIAEKRHKRSLKSVVYSKRDDISFQRIILIISVINIKYTVYQRINY